MQKKWLWGSVSGTTGNNKSVLKVQMTWCSLLWYLTKGSAQRFYLKKGEGGITLVYVKGQLLTTAVEAGMKNTSSDGYW